MQQFTPEQRRRLVIELRDNRRMHGEVVMRVKDKKGKIVALVYNDAQRYLDEIADRQLRETGMVRILVLKGRQQGISTYIAHRFYHKATLQSGKNVFILAHDQGASDNLFDIVERFSDHTPSWLVPNIGNDNAKELEFPRLDSRYTVAIAGIKAGGRSRNNQLFHGSEVAFWQNAEAHFAASVETVADIPGTEIFLETTANGVDNEFYSLWIEAEKGKSDYIAVFIPWFWQSEYQREVPDGFKLRDYAEEEGELTEVEYRDMFDLTFEQMMWRRQKIQKLRSVKLFNQEYPGTAEMAFAYSDPDAYIKPLSVLRARKRNIEEVVGPLILGIDPAGEGDNRFAVAARIGLKVPWIKWRMKVTTLEAVVWIKDLIDTHNPAAVFIDSGGLGAAIISACRDLGEKYNKVIISVNFGGKSQAKMARPKKPGPRNRRAEMYKRLKEWLELEEGVDLPDIDDLQRDICSVRWKPTLTNDLQLESKQQMKKRGVKSPDLGDAVVLTFASLRYIPEFTESISQSAQSSKKEPKRISPDDLRSSSPDSWMS